MSCAPIACGGAVLAVLSMANTDNYGCELGVRGRGGGVHGRSVPNGTMNLASSWQVLYCGNFELERL
jgi:hypothetical protein